MAFSRPAKDKTFCSRLKPFFAFERFQSSFVKDGSFLHVPAQSSKDKVGIPKWKKLDAKKMGIAKSMISLDSWKVVEGLKNAGFDAYLVGGCVRDLLLKRVPKDFDVITTARLEQVKRKFKRAIIVGRRFPVCMVHMKESMVEVTSFGTAAKQSKRKQICPSAGCDKKDITLWNDCMRRDFTINSLFYDPFGHKIFDYSDAMVDLMSMKLRTITPAHLSFKEDQARILRGLRLAARLNLSFSEETESAIYDLSPSVADIDKSRLSLELNYMLSYGAAESSLILLKRFKLLEILLPFQAAHLSEHADDRLGPRHLMLMKLFFNLDRLITCDRPCDSSMWVALLSFHLALVNNPQNVLVVLTFASLLHHGTWEKSIKFARQHAPAAQIYIPEILDTCESLSDDEIAKRVTKLAVQVNNSVNVLFNKDCHLKAAAKFPRSGLVFVSRNMRERVENFFRILTEDVRSLKSKANRKGLKINYRFLKEGNIGEIRFVLGHIIMETLASGSNAEIGEAELKNVDIHEYQKPQIVEVLEQIRDISSMHLRKVDSIRKHDNKQSSFPDSAAKTSSNKDNGIVTSNDTLSRKQGSESSGSVGADKHEVEFVEVLEQIRDKSSTHLRKVDSIRKHHNKQSSFPDSAGKTSSNKDKSSSHLRKVDSIRKHDDNQSSFPDSAAKISSNKDNGIVTSEDTLSRKQGSESSGSVGPDKHEVKFVEVLEQIRDNGIVTSENRLNRKQGSESSGSVGPDKRKAKAKTVPSLSSLFK